MREEESIAASGGSLVLLRHGRRARGRGVWAGERREGDNGIVGHGLLQEGEDVFPENSLPAFLLLSLFLFFLFAL